MKYSLFFFACRVTLIEANRIKSPIIGVAAWDADECWYRVEWVRDWDEREKECPAAFVLARLARDQICSWMDEGFPGYDPAEMRRVIEKTTGWYPQPLPRLIYTDAWWELARKYLPKSIRMTEPLSCNFTEQDNKIESLLKGQGIGQD